MIVAILPLAVVRLIIHQVRTAWPSLSLDSLQVAGEDHPLVFQVIRRIHGIMESDGPDHGRD